MEPKDLETKFNADCEIYPLRKATSGVKRKTSTPPPSILKQSKENDGDIE